jgi:hypothetical protein
MYLLFKPKCLLIDAIDKILTKDQDIFVEFNGNSASQTKHAKTKTEVLKT